MDRLAPLKAWSYSTYSNFTKCPHRVYRDKVLKDPTLPLVPPPGKDEHPLERGTRIHDAAEMYLKEEVELIEELQPFAEGFEALKFLTTREDFHFVIEDKWAFRKNWEIEGWSSIDAYLRMKLDCLVIKEDEGLLIDYKTGRRHGNEISHAIQAQLYQVAAFIRFPQLEHVQVEYWYIDQKEITVIPFSREFGMRFVNKFDAIGEQITSEVDFAPKPSAHACRFCPFGKQNGTGACLSAY